MMLMMKSLSPLPLTRSAVMVLFANIAYHEVRGAVMGISETIACVTRCIVPPRPLFSRVGTRALLHAVLVDALSPLWTHHQPQTHLLRIPSIPVSRVGVGHHRPRHLVSRLLDLSRNQREQGLCEEDIVARSPQCTPLVFRSLFAHIPHSKHSLDHQERTTLNSCPVSSLIFPFKLFSAVS